MKKSISFFLFVLILAVAGCKESKKTSGELFNEAYSNMQAGRIDRAEVLFQDAILLGGENNFIKNELIDLYVKSKQWDKLESYLSLNEQTLDWIGKSRGYWALASENFDRKNWASSARFFSKTAEAYSDLSGAPDNRKTCMLARPEVLRNAAAAHYNNKDFGGVVSALDKLKEMDKNPKCQEQMVKMEVKKHLIDTEKMAKQMFISGNY